MTTTGEAGGATLRRDTESGGRQSLADVAAAVLGELAETPGTLFVRARATTEDIAPLANAAHCNALLLEKGVFLDIQPDDAKIGWIEIANGTCHLPVGLGPTLIVLGDPFEPNPRLALALYRSGARKIVVRRGFRWHRHDLLRIAARRTLKAVVHRGLQQAQRWQLRFERASSGPVSQVGARALRGARQFAIRARSTVERDALEIGHLTADSLPISPRVDFVRDRVLMFNSALAWGGAERQLVNTMIGLQQRGFEVALACENLGRVADSEFFAPILKQHDLRFGPLDAGPHDTLDHLSQRSKAALEQDILRLPQHYQDAVWPFVMRILSDRPAVVHAWQDQTNIMAGVAATLVGVPRIILSTRNVSPQHFAYHQPYMRQAYKALGLHPNVRLINNSQAGASDYVDWLGVPASAFTVVHNGFDFADTAEYRSGSASEYRCKLGIPGDSPIIGSIFRFYLEKDPMLWLEMAQALSQRFANAHFLLVGTGPMRDDMLAQAQSYGLTDRFHLPGTLKDVQSALHAMDVFVLSSRFEGLPNVLIEAQAAGVPVVSTQAGGAAETFANGNTCWLVQSRDANDIAARVAEILADPDWARRARELAPRLVRERFGLDRMIAETANLYTQ